jgi:hypothetical protein
MEFDDDEVRIDKPPSDLDRLVLDVASVLEEVGVDYAVVSGYVVVLFGRARATEDVDVIVERFDADTGAELAERLADAGYWGPAMPLADLHGTLADDLPVRVAEDGHRVPNVELKFPTDRYDRASVRETVTVRFDDETVTVGNLELQIAYKLHMDTPKDFEDALYLHEVAEPTLNTRTLEEYVDDLDVEDAYDRLRDA